MNHPIRQIRQGDVLLLRIEEPEGPELATGPDGLPLAGVRIEGERTGHAHELPGVVYDLPGGRRAVRLGGPTPITHQEHAHLVVPEGWWEVRTQREWVPAEQRWGGQTRGRWD